MAFDLTLKLRVKRHVIPKGCTVVLKGRTGVLKARSQVLEGRFVVFEDHTVVFEGRSIVLRETFRHTQGLKSLASRNLRPGRTPPGLCPTDCLVEVFL